MNSFLFTLMSFGRMWEFNEQLLLGNSNVPKMVTTKLNLFTNLYKMNCSISILCH